MNKINNLDIDSFNIVDNKEYYSGLKKFNAESPNLNTIFQKKQELIDNP